MICSDGTNAKVLHKEALHVATVKARFISIKPDGSFATDNFDEHWSDLLKQKGKTANHTYSYIQKQTEGVGAIPWTTEIDKFLNMATFDEGGDWSYKPGCTRPRGWITYTMCGDCGGDQEKSRDGIACAVAIVPGCWSSAGGIASCIKTT